MDELAERGNQLMEEERYEDALKIFREGFDLIPHPRVGKAASRWFIVAIGDAQWFLRDLANSVDTWRDAIILYGAFGNPFAHLRRGQVLFELGDEKEASNELMRALLLGGEDIFIREPLEHWVFITSIANAPEGYPDWIGWPGVEKDSPTFQWLMEFPYKATAKPRTDR